MTLTVAKLIATRITTLGKPQVDIAREAGFNKPNMVTMIKHGTAKLPLDKIGPMAQALEIDAGVLLQLCLAEYLPQTWEAIMPYMADLLTMEEAALVKAIRSRTTADNVPFLGSNQQLKLNEFLITLAPLKCIAGHARSVTWN